MEFKSLMDTMLSTYKNFEQVNQFVSSINLLSPASKLALAQKVLTFQKESPLINQSLQLVQAGWNDEDISKADSAIKVALNAVATSVRAADEESIRLALNNVTVVDLTDKTVATPNQKEVISSEEVNQSINSNAEILYNPWLTRLFKVGSVAVAVIAIAAICFVLYKYKDELGKWAQDLYETVSSAFGKMIPGSKARGDKLGYPFEKDAELLAECSKHAKMVMSLADMLSISEEMCIKLLGCIKAIEIDKALEYYSMERRVQDVRGSYRNHRPVAKITRQVEFSGR